MQRGNITATRVKPESARPLRLHVLRSERLSPHFARVTRASASGPAGRKRRNHWS